jgi:hypothetical protein
MYYIIHSLIRGLPLFVEKTGEPGDEVMILAVCEVGKVIR